MSLIIDVHGVTVSLGGREVLRDVNFGLEAGELVGLIGPNGAGKTTLLRTLLGLIRPRSGTIDIGGATARASRGRLGYVPQRHEFVWDFPISIEDAVMTGRYRRIGWLRRPALADYRAVNAALERVRLLDLRKRPVAELSGGQKQRVLVARALALESALLLLDEPFTGLDMPSQELLTELFTQLAREGRTILMSTHDLPHAMHTCDRLLMLNRTVTATGTPADLRRRSLWMDTFQVSDNSPLLAGVGAVAA
ncbi:anchored repeat-type ABC transporter ATP-binding subunit [Brevibacterium album]|uniref:anchored repeat-type ABC transporter ATP-binding subunit n=1 Tax=Brevibacterium album TaxID=417948 RepID=UPI000403E9F8|nr:anchored repeat-type ABC transporter ATP-binding subunit [Brevibacterium album]